jgi:hypothetical protein
MIKVSGNRPIRSTTAVYVTDDGSKVEITVEYYSRTPAYQKKLLAEAQKADEKYAAEVEAAEKKGKKAPMRFMFEFDDLVNDVVALRDSEGNPFADEKGKPMKITVENLDKIDIRNLKAIRKAIADDISGKKSEPAE